MTSRAVGSAAGAIWLILLLAAANLAAQPQLEVELEAESLSIGKLFELSLRITADEGELDGPPRFPVWGEGWGELEVARVLPTDRARLAGGRVEYRQVVELRSFRLGGIALPPIEVRIPFDNDTLQLTSRDPLSVQIQGLLDGSVHDAEPRPAVPAASLPLGLRFWLTAALLLGGCLVTAPGLLRYQRSHRSTPLAAPLAEFRHALDEIGQFESRAVHIVTSFALRRFLGRSFNWPALESTRREIVERLQGTDLPAALVAEVNSVLGDSDAVVFAHLRLDNDAVRLTLERARQVAEQIDRHLELEALYDDPALETG